MKILYVYLCYTMRNTRRRLDKFLLIKSVPAGIDLNIGVDYVGFIMRRCPYLNCNQFYLCIGKQYFLSTT